MTIYPEIKKIANKLSQIQMLVNRLQGNADFDTEGLDFYTAEIVSGLSAREDGLYKNDCLIAENEGDYYCNQSTGYCEDDYYGYLYFKTDVPGQFVRIYFNM